MDNGTCPDAQFVFICTDLVTLFPQGLRGGTGLNTDAWSALLSLRIYTFLGPEWLDTAYSFSSIWILDATQAIVEPEKKYISFQI